ncbi:MAG: phage tail protein, partial [Sphingomonas bacterium]|nr:phage tail protein [Sphingomonas bacterium]
MTRENILRARQGDPPDGLLWRERGLGGAAIAAVLEANPGLARLGPVLPIGTAVIVPD